MWNKTYSKRVCGVPLEKIWDVWCDVAQWHTWQTDVEYAQLDGAFQVGSSIKMKLKEGSEVSFEIVSIEEGRAFTDVTRFPGARMFDCHEVIAHGDEVEIRTSLRMEGLLSFLWRKIVGENVAKGMADQTDALIERAKNV